ncbi:MAG: hypothetical protein CFE22_07170 [Cytophagaceae bacterium BCCC1]|nr:MAG: hypothetical protein CFE22_07170 [Cytophagaceae bacterium BCCC1]
MKVIFYLILLFGSCNLKGQIREFDKACDVIRSIHGGKIKKIVVREKLNGNDYFLYNYYFKVKTLDEVSKAENIGKDIVFFENNTIKSNIFMNLKDSKYYREKGLGKYKSAILIEFVKFDGKFLRVNAEIGSFWKAKYKPSTTFYEYQFVFDKYGGITFLDWIEKKE